MVREENAKLVKVASVLRAQVRQSLLMYGLPCSESAITLLVMVAAHESGGFRYVQQIGGPALGLFQIF